MTTEMSEEARKWLKAMEEAEERGLTPPEPSEAVKIERGIIEPPVEPEPEKVVAPPTRIPTPEKTVEEALADLGFPPGTIMPADWYEETGYEPPPEVREREPEPVEEVPLVEPEKPPEEKPPEEPPVVPPVTEWRPDFRKEDPYEDMPPEYEAMIKETFVPTEEHPVSPIEEARARGEIVAGVIAPRIEVPPEVPPVEVPPPEPPEPALVEPTLLTREEKKEYEAASPEEQFELGIKYGYIPVGSEYVPPFTEAQAAELLPKLIEEFGAEKAEKELPPVVGWGFYSPEQLKEQEEIAEARQVWASTTILRSKELKEAADVFEKQLKEQTPDLHKIYTEKGPEAYNQYIKDNYTELPDGQWMSNDTLDIVKKQSQYGYDIIINKGYSAYQDAVAQALEDVEPFKKWRGYRLRRAYTQGVSEDTLSLIFSSEDVAKATRSIYEPKEEKKEEAKVTSTLPPELLGILPIGGVVALAEPTIVGEIILGVVVLGGVAFVAMQGKEVSFTALMDEIKKTFSSETGRPATKEEIAQMETMATNVIQGTLIPATAVQIESGSPPLIPPRVDIGLTTPPIRVVDIPTGTRLIPPKVDWGKTTPPITAVDIKTGTIILPVKVDLPQLIMAQTGVKTAVKELEDIIVIIRPVVSDPGKFPLVTITKTETALVALDKAVGEAYTAGEIDADLLRIYADAREKYLTKKGILDTASRAYIGGMQPQLINSTQDLAALAFTTATNSLIEQASKAAIDAYNKAITDGMTQTQAQQAAQTAAREAIQTQTQVIAQQAVKTATKTITKTVTKPVAKTLTSAATQTAIQTAVQTAVNTAVQTLAQTLAVTATGELIIPPPLPPIKKVPVKLPPPVPEGAYAWKQGMYWKYIPPPYDIDKPITLPKGVVPEGAKLGKTPQETIQMIGLKKGVIPKDVSVDLGIVDAFITAGATRITFTGKGEETDVGQRLPSPTKGMSIPAVKSEDIYSPPAKKVKRKSAKRAKSKRKAKDNDQFGGLTSLRGHKF